MKTLAAALTRYATRFTGRRLVPLQHSPEPALAINPLMARDNGESPPQAPLRIGAYIGWIAAATLAFIQPLTQLMLDSARSPLNSYIPLVPGVVLYLLYTQRKRLTSAYRSSIGGAAALGGVGGAALAAAIGMRGSLSVNDGLTLTALAYVCVVSAGGFLFLGRQWMATAAFPVAFLIFMVPLPDVAVTRIETASVLASADVSAWLFRLTGTPLVRDGEILTLPGIVLVVAQQCSGIHSSWVLFMTSLVASHMFLASPWRRLVLVAFVFPLAIVRNSVRIVVIGLLCVHVGPHMIDSYIHRQGGPVFFALSLVPLMALLLWLRRQER
jgi:exosortase C (VPDSG-CTERM-specific)